MKLTITYEDRTQETFWTGLALGSLKHGLIGCLMGISGYRILQRPLNSWLHRRLRKITVSGSIIAMRMLLTYRDRKAWKIDWMMLFLLRFRLQTSACTSSCMNEWKGGGMPLTFVMVCRLWAVQTAWPPFPMMEWCDFSCPAIIKTLDDSELDRVPSCHGAYFRMSVEHPDRVLSPFSLETATTKQFF